MHPINSNLNSWGMGEQCSAVFQKTSINNNKKSIFYHVWRLKFVIQINLPYKQS